jgi:hypothetical protein
MFSTETELGFGGFVVDFKSYITDTITFAGAPRNPHNVTQEIVCPAIRPQPA